MTKYFDVNMEAHLRYIMAQKHTRGDIVRAKKALSLSSENRRKGLIVGECLASSDIRAPAKTQTTGNTSFVTIKGRHWRLSDARCRVMKA